MIFAFFFKYVWPRKLLYKSSPSMHILVLQLYIMCAFFKNKTKQRRPHEVFSNKHASFAIDQVLQIFNFS